MATSCPLFPDTTEQSSEEHPHAFCPPVEGDSRSPCPALNTLANHGYLPRSGWNITSHDFIAALCSPETYNISPPLARFLVYGGHFLMHELKAPSISLHELARHGRIEHNASMVHKDAEPGRKFAPSRCDTTLLNNLLEEKPLTVDRVAKRRVVLEEASPLDPVHQEIARGEWALVLDVFGRENGGEVQPRFMRVWLKENRFPEGWRPMHQQGFMDTVLKAYEIRQKMNEYRKDLEVLSPDECVVVMDTEDVMDIPQEKD